MALMSSEIRVLQFADFTLDLTLRQLRRGTDVLPVSGKAFDLLAYMAQNPGRPLEKQELLAAVWPGSFVEEGNLSQNVFLLRKVLGSGAASPISTLPGRGYMFTAKVAEPVALQEPSVATQMLQATHTRVLVEEETEEHISAWRSPWVLSLSGVGLVLLAISGWLGWQRWEDRTGGPPVQAVLANLKSNTGDAVLDHTLEDAFRIELAQSPFVTVVSSANVRRTLLEMSHKPDEALTPSVARDICERTGSQVVLEEELAKVGERFLLTTQATNCVDGVTVAAARRQVAGIADLPSAIQSVAASLRHGLGESRRSIARFNTALLPAVTPSLEALKDYSQAARLGQQAKFLEAISLLKQAIAIDPNFATAYLELAVDSADISDAAGQREYIIKAYENREHATEPARRFILAQYDAVVTQDLHQSLLDLQTWADLYPHSAVPLAGLCEVYRELEMPAESAAAAQRAIKLSPSYSILYYGMAAEQVASGDIDGAKATAALAIQRGYDTDQVHMVLYRIGVLTHDTALLQKQDEWIALHPGSVYTLLTKAETLRNEGQFQRAHDLLAMVERSLQERGQASLIPVFDNEFSVGLARLGDIADARTLRHPGVGSDSTEEAALLSAELGDAAAATASLKKHLQEAPQGTLWNDLYGPDVRARLLLRQNQPREALAALKPSTDFLDRDLDLRLTHALAQYALKDFAGAESDLRYILAHAYLDPVSSALPAAQYQLALVLLEEGKVPEGQQALQTFLARWNHTDHDAVLYQEATAHLHRIGQGSRG